MDTLHLWQARSQLVARSSRKEEFAKNGALVDVVPLLVNGDPTELRLASDIVGSLARGATSSTLLALLRSDALPCAIFALGRAARQGYDGLLVLSLARTIQALVWALADHVSASIRWGIGTDWGSAAYIGYDAALHESVLKKDYVIDGGPSMEYMRGRLFGRLGQRAHEALTGMSDDHATNIIEMTSGALDEVLYADSLGSHTALVWLARRAITHMYTSSLDKLLEALLMGDASVGEAICDVLSCSVGISMDGSDDALVARYAHIARYTGALDRIVELAMSDVLHIQQAALWALASIGDYEDVISRLSLCSTVEQIAQIVRRSPEHSVAACSVLVCLARADRVPKIEVLAFLVVLLAGDISIQIQACFCISRLVCDDEALQMHAISEHKLIELLYDMVRAPPANTELGVRRHEACLTVLATMSFQSDIIRQRIIEASPALFSRVVVPSLDLGACGIQVAACRLIRSFARTLGILRTSMYDAGIAAPLLHLMRTTHSERIRSEIIAALSNLVVKFSPIREFLLENGVIDLLCGCAHNSVHLGALWALKNTLWESDTECKHAVMNLLGWDFLAGVLMSDDQACEQGFNIVRNLTTSCDGSKHDVTATVDGLGDRLFVAIEHAVAHNIYPALVHAAFVLVNVADGTDAHRNVLMNRPQILEALCYFLVRQC